MPVYLFLGHHSPVILINIYVTNKQLGDLECFFKEKVVKFT